MEEVSVLTNEKVDRHSNAPRIVAIIPAFNEERFIGSVVLKGRACADVVLVIDDGSSDLTAEIAEAAGAVVIRHTKNQGKGEALNTGFREAREIAAEVVVVLDADGQHKPSEIQIVTAPILEGRADIVIGSRFLEVKNDIPKWRVIGQHLLTWATNLGSGISVTDSQSGFRAFSARAIELISLGQAGFSVESEMQFLAREHGLNVLEVPITCSYEDGVKRNPFFHGLQVLNGLLTLVGHHRPLLFFGLPGLVSLVFGLFWGWGVTRTFYEGGILPIGQALITVLLCIIGVFSLFTGIILHSIRALLLQLKNSLR